jgi:hypothetical protein
MQEGHPNNRNKLKEPIMKSSIALAVLTASMTLMPAFAQNEISNNQPLNRNLSEDEVRIEAKLKLDFKKGLIDANQLAQMQRDFDGILVHEDAEKAKGLTSDGRASIKKSLCEFECKLDKAAGVVTTQGAENKNGPKADENNAGLSQIAPTR